jgi:hypothetical protein
MSLSHRTARLLREGVWISLGTALPDADGRARIVAEDDAIAFPPEALRVTLEPASGSAKPQGRAVVAWPSGEPAPRANDGG